MVAFEGSSQSFAGFKQFVRSQILEPSVPPRLRARFLELAAAELRDLETSLRENFFSRQPAGYLESDFGRRDLQTHLIGRLDLDRKWCIPWLDAARALDGARVLEIGCGTGVTTQALAEQGAKVVAIDVDGPALRVARRRLELHGLDAELHEMSAVGIEAAFTPRSFDFIIYWASLEHMTHDERMSTMRQSWRMLPQGSMWVVIETPNRLHFHDSHTSFLPFFHWLPDDVALEYAQFSIREGYRTDLAGRSLANAADRETLARWGRGMSYHEFELTMKPVAELKVVSSMLGYNAEQNAAYRARQKVSRDTHWATLLRRLKPDAHPAFFEPYLNLIIQRT
ncbi:MAG: methyltransferase domain-containing protein [Hyphomicrobiaceae bacterium]|nr:methyltransferase domain-containing protein [Hyphomicrobiaceae bacterium]